MDAIDQILQQLTPVALTGVLVAHGHLAHGHVAAVRVSSRFETPPSTIARLAVEYSDDAPTGAPARLFLKAPKPHKLARGRQEVLFYMGIAPDMPGGPLVRCYGAGVETQTQTPYLLLEDFGDTHSMPSNVITRQDMQSMLDALARLHAAWWDHPRLADVIPERPETAFANDVDGNQHRLAELAHRLGDALTAQQWQVFQRFIQTGPALLIGRATSGAPLTLCHPDGHPWNFLLPHEVGGQVYIADWHQYRRWWGPKDVAVLIIRSREAEHRAFGGQHLVRYYYDRLVHYGVVHYSWAGCWHDYRLGMIEYLSFPLWSTNEAAIEPFIEAMLQLFHDIDGAELLC